MPAVPKRTTPGQLYDSAILKVAAEEQKNANADPLFPAAEPNPLKVFLGGYTPMISLGVVQKDRYNAGAYTSDESIEYLIIGEGGNVGKTDFRGLGKRPNTFYGAPEYYINNFEVDTIHVPDSQVGSTSATRFQFQVFEPYSMGLFYQSMLLAANKAGYPNYQEAVFVLKIEFKGWEQNNTFDVKPSTAPGTTRYFAISLVNSQMSFNETGSIYTVNAISAAIIPQLSIYSNIKRSIIITGAALSEILTTGSRSLTQALKAQELKSENEAIVGEADEYLIEIFPEATSMLSSKLSTGGPRNSGFVDAKNVFNTSRNQVITQSMTFTFPSVTEGITIPKMIDEVMLHSEYCINSIKNAQKDPSGYMDWYRIETRFEFKKITNSGAFAKKLIYVVVPYKAHSSVWQPPADRFKGASLIRQSIVRKYEYLYTGQNDDIIKWELNFDFLHFTAINVTDPGNSATNSLAVAGKIEKETLYTANSGDDLSQLGRVTGTNRIFRSPNAAEAPEYGAYADDAAVKVARIFQHALRSTNDKGKIRVEMEIVGDPYYLSEAGVFLIDKSSPDAQVKRPSGAKELIRSNGSMADGESEIRVFLGIRTPIDAPADGSLFEFPRGYSPFSGLYKILRTKNIIKDGVFTQRLTLLRDLQQDIAELGDEKLNAARTNTELGLYRTSGESNKVGDASVSSNTSAPPEPPPPAAAPAPGSTADIEGLKQVAVILGSPTSISTRPLETLPPPEPPGRVPPD
jgi:hypothetical protein